MLSQLDQPKLFATTNFVLLQGVLERLLDGVLILTQQGEQVYVNDAACRICQEISQDQPIPPVPVEVWRICQMLLVPTDPSNHQRDVIEADIRLGQSQVYRVRVRWLLLEDSQQPYLMVLLEDCYQSLQNQAIADVQRYGLTRRQAEVWCLHRMGKSYQNIATELFISLNTVKKHIKDIYVKQQNVKQQNVKQQNVKQQNVKQQNVKQQRQNQSLSCD